ncbi:MAG: sodium:proton antiporter [Chloroflexi bacterium]|nr:MAG: sodium:proton antiporter [Chloroflexota bacterium]
MVQASTTIGALEIFVALLAVASGVALLTRRLTAVPYSEALVILGVAVAALRPPVEATIEPDLILAVLLPALVFEAAYRTDIRILAANLPAVALLAIPGVLISAAAVALVLELLTGLPFGLAFLVGTMLAATDPAAILSVVGRLGVPRSLTTLVEAESLFNDGTGIVIFVLALQALDTGLDGGQIVVGLVVTTVVSSAIGVGVGFVTSRLMAGIEDHLIELTLSMVAAYGSYLAAAQLGQSGLIATVACGLVLGTYGRRVGISRRAAEAIDTVWEFLAFLGTTLVFLLIGLAIGLPQLIASAGAAGAALVALIVARAVVVYGLLGGAAGILTRIGWMRAVPRGWLHLVAWSGLRGAVSVALALSLPPGLPQRETLQGIVFGCVLFTLLLQGTSSQLLVSRMRLERDPA